MEIIFHSHVNKTHFHKKGCGEPHFESEGFWISEVAYFVACCKVKQQNMVQVAKQ